MYLWTVLLGSGNGDEPQVISNNLPLLFTVVSQVLYNWVSAFVVVRRECDERVDVRPEGRGRLASNLQDIGRGVAE
jgi:hypothetical protein